MLALSSISIARPANGVVEEPPKPGYVGVDFTDLTYETTSYLITEATAQRTEDRSINPLCGSVNDAKCKGKLLSFNAIMPLCADTTDMNCVVSLEAIDGMGRRFPAQSKGYYPSAALTSFAGDPNLHIPSGAASGVWTLPGARHCGGTDYGVIFSAEGSYGDGNAVAGINNIQIRLSPISIVSGSNTEVAAAIGSGPGCDTANQGIWLCEKDGWANKNAENASLVPDWDSWHSIAGNCAVKFPFPKDFRFRVTVRTNLLNTGWLHGRLADPRVQMSKVPNGSEINVEAAPVEVSSVVAFIPWKDLSSEEQATYDSQGMYRCPDGNHLGNRGGLGPDPATRSTITQASSSGECSMLLLKTWFPHIADKATESRSIWSLRNLGPESQSNSVASAEMNTCFNDSSSVAGLVTTNSTTYLAGPPTFNKTEGVLTYKVSSPHFSPDESVFRGTYNLALRSDVARCIYKFTSAPISASIEVVNENGSEQVATTSMVEKNGWIYLSASGFTYSSPTLKVKFEQAQSAAPIGPVVPAAPTPVASTPVTEASVGVSKTIPRVAPIQKSITCVKGKTIKKVTAVNPKCPAGYQKK